MTLRTSRVPPSNPKNRIRSSATMPLETLAISTAQAAAFFTLNLGYPQLQDDRQFEPLGNGNAYAPDDPDGRSPLNTPVYGRIVLGNEDGNNTYTDAQGKEGTYPTIQLDCAIVHVAFNNKVVVTDIQGLPTSIKEWISNADNDVTITGRFDGDVDVAPMDFIIGMNKLFRAPVPIPVANYYLNALDIHYLVIMPGTEMGQEQGGYAYQTFTIRAISDTPMTELLP